MSTFSAGFPVLKMIYVFTFASRAKDSVPMKLLQSSISGFSLYDYPYYSGCDAD